MTLLTETRDALERIRKDATDIAWIGNRDGTLILDWYDFAALANVEYNNDNYNPWVATDLVIVGKSGWFIEREHDYDHGREYWSIHTFPRMQVTAKRGVVRLLRTEHEHGTTLQELNNEQGLRELKHSQLTESKLSLERALAELLKTEKVLGNDTPEAIMNARRDLEDRIERINEELEDYE